MEIKTERLTLETLGTKHLQSTHGYASDPELTRLMVFLPTADIAETERYLKKSEAEAAKEHPQFYEMAVMLDGRHIGSVSAYLEEDGTAWELGWIMARGAHGHGYATEAAKALMDYCRWISQIRRFIAHCDSENTASQRVMKNLGFRFIEEHSGRKNRGSDEIRSEMLFARVLPDLILRPYKKSDAEKIIAWNKSEYAFRQWCADRYKNYPVTAEEINANYDSMADSEDFCAFTACDECGPVGHLTMRFPGGDKRTVRFGFVIVDPDKRRQSYGTEMLRLAVKYAFSFLKAERITLGVFDNNLSAWCCYTAVGFREIKDPDRRLYHCMGERWACVEMELLP